MTAALPTARTTVEARFGCPVCRRPVIPGHAGNIQHHYDNVGNACEGSGLPFHTTGARYTR